MADTAVWVYAIGMDLDEGQLDAAISPLSGVGEEPVRPLRAADLVAVVGQVDRDRFGEAAMQRQLNDIAQLEVIARAHHRVIETVARVGTVAPSRLATIYDDDDRVRSMLEREAEAVMRALRYVRGRQEWGVKVFAEPAPPEPEPTRPSSGAAYLRQRQAALASRQASRDATVLAADAVHQRLSKVAVGARRHNPQDRQLTGDARPMVLNGAYLVDADAGEAFSETVASVGQAHSNLDIRLTGPWPPYSFVAADPGPK
jgi:Gas vesicle synthesis protein GvpL/GvpF